jgi:hypothetical protein
MINIITQDRDKIYKYIKIMINNTIKKLKIILKLYKLILILKELVLLLLIFKMLLKTFNKEFLHITTKCINNNIKINKSR